MAGEELMPEGVHHYDESSDMPENIQKSATSECSKRQMITDRQADTGTNAMISGLVTMRVFG